MEAQNLGDLLRLGSEVVHKELPKKVRGNKFFARQEMRNEEFSNVGTGGTGKISNFVDLKRLEAGGPRSS